jgi:hypothetical protein
VGRHTLRRQALAFQHAQGCPSLIAADAEPAQLLILERSAPGLPIAAPISNAPGPYLLLVVSVVVVVTGPGCVVCCVLVVVLVSVGVAQPESETRAAITRQGAISFFICIFGFRGGSVIHRMMAQSEDRVLWGVALQPQRNDLDFV